MARRYAEGTVVAVERSQAEIRKVVMQYGAEQYMTGEKAGMAIVGFVVCGKQIRFALPLPDPESPEFKKTPMGRSRSGSAANEAFEAEIKRRWRALALIVKSKLEAVESGIVSFEQEFLPYFVLPGGVTVADAMLPQIDDAYRSGKIPLLLPNA